MRVESQDPEEEEQVAGLGSWRRGEGVRGRQSPAMR